jgi:hypothetical protein
MCINEGSAAEDTGNYPLTYFNDLSSHVVLAISYQNLNVLSW